MTLRAAATGKKQPNLAFCRGLDYNIAMEFWDQYLAESLQSPWFIRPEGGENHEAETSPLQNRVFVVGPAADESDLDDAAFEMLSKMIAALNYQPSEVSVLSNGATDIDQLEQLSENKKILFFGGFYPGRLGEAVHWAGHQVIQTHSLKQLLVNADLKKHTWQHLKSFAGLK